MIIFTSQHRALADFYCGALDLPEPEAFGDDHLGIQLEHFYLGFDESEASEGHRAGGVSLWFAVPDLDASFARFVELGADVRCPPEVKPFGDRLASVYDPDGNIIGLVERK